MHRLLGPALVADADLTPAVTHFCTPMRVEIGSDAAFDRFVKGTETTTLTVRGARVPVWRWANADASRGTVVLAHGWSANSAIWRAWVRALLGAGYVVAAFDAPAHGRATATTSNLLIHTDSILAVRRWLIDDHGDNVTAMVGHSLGGLALCVALYLLHDAHDVLPLRSVVLATPASMRAILVRYQQATGASDEACVEIADWMTAGVGFRPREIGLGLLLGVTGYSLLAMHARNDTEADFETTAAAFACHAPVTWAPVDDLGHERIVASRPIVRAAVSFLSAPVLCVG